MIELAISQGTEKHLIPGHSEINNLTSSIKKKHLSGPPPRRVTATGHLSPHYFMTQLLPSILGWRWRNASSGLHLLLCPFLTSIGVLTWTVVVVNYRRFTLLRLLLFKRERQCIKISGTVPKYRTVSIFTTRFLVPWKKHEVWAGVIWMIKSVMVHSILKYLDIIVVANIMLDKE